MSEPVAVRVRDCACPGTPHTDEGDVIYLRPTIGLDGGLAAEAAYGEAIQSGIRELPDGSDEERATLAAERLRLLWLPIFVRYGALDWNLWDEDGPIRFDVQKVLDDYALAQPVADKAADLYYEAVMLPLARRQLVLSAIGQINGSTSRTQSTPSRRRRSSHRRSGGKQ